MNLTLFRTYTKLRDSYKPGQNLIPAVHMCAGQV